LKRPPISTQFSRFTDKVAQKPPASLQKSKLERSKNMKYLTTRTTRLLLEGVLITALACVTQSGRIYGQLLSADDDDGRTNQGPPLSIAFHSNSVGNTEVYVMNPDGTDQTRLTFDPRTDQQPDISPDGRQIVFCSTRIADTNPEGDFEVFVMDADGSNARQLTFNGANISDAWPRWSPNGKQIVFHSNVDGNFEIYIINADGTDLNRVTEYSGVDQFPEWSPNGKQLAIRRDTDIYLINTDGTDPVQLTNNATIDQMASWSPNGKQIAFMSSRDGYCSVYVMSSDGSDQTNLTPKPDGVPANQFCSRAPAWARNGQQIYFSSFRPETNLFENIFVMNSAGGDVTRLTFDNSTVSVAAVR
jgi:Periplasmic component of the Tol biopolymer transport system